MMENQQSAPNDSISSIKELFYLTWELQVLPAVGGETEVIFQVSQVNSAFNDIEHVSLPLNYTRHK